MYKVTKYYEFNLKSIDNDPDAWSVNQPQCRRCGIGSQTGNVVGADI